MTRLLPVACHQLRNVQGVGGSPNSYSEDSYIVRRDHHAQMSSHVASVISEFVQGLLVGAKAAKVL